MPRSSSTTSASTPARRNSSNDSPTGSSTRTRRCGRRRTCSPRNRRGAPGLWPHGISGDLPIVLVRIDQLDDVDIVRQLLRAHEYWRLKLLDVDLVIVNEHGATYAEDLHGSLESLVRASQSTLGHQGHPSHGGVFVLRGERLSAEDRTLLLTAARAVLLSRRGSLADQVIRLERPSSATGPHRCRRAGRRHHPPTSDERQPPLPQLEFFNGLGRVRQGRARVRHRPRPGPVDARPWLNVIANPSFGFQVSESGAGLHVGGEQPGEPADAVVQRSGQRSAGRGALRPRRRQRRAVESDRATDSMRGVDLRRTPRRRIQPVRALPRRHPARPRPVRPARRAGEGLRAHRGEPVRADAAAVGHRLRRVGARHVAWRRARRGSSPSREPETQALLATQPVERRVRRTCRLPRPGWAADRVDRRPHRVPRPQRRARAPGGPRPRTPTAADGRGRAGSVRRAADELRARRRASGPRSSSTLGQAEHARGRDRSHPARRAAPTTAPRCARSQRSWDDVQATIQVRTPDRSMDIMLNGWLVYQTLACRLWARAALYQAGGAYGFRDQLQDVIALIVPQRRARPRAPAPSRQRVSSSRATSSTGGIPRPVAACARTSPTTGCGCRTSVDRYLAVTADHAVLDETIPYLEGPPLAPEQHDAYFQPEQSARRRTLFEHCAAAIDCSLGVGSHGLPADRHRRLERRHEPRRREGSGRERLARAGSCIARSAAFVPIAEARGDARTCRPLARAHGAACARALEEHGWDGDWYRRAFFDDGTPLGSASNVECRIDSIAQSWSVLSGAADRSRAERAMAAVDEYLIRRGDGLVLLFTPPFDHADLDPGYIKGYLPGVRENGGQYTHGAIWSVLAFAALGDGNKAGELFSILNPINHASTTAGVLPLQGRAVRHGRRRLRRAAAHRPRRLDLVHGRRRMDVPGRHRVDPRLPSPRHGTEARPVHPHDVAAATRSDSAITPPRYEIVVENPHAVSRGIATTELDGELLPDAPPSRFTTTARHTGCVSCSAPRPR